MTTLEWLLIVAAVAGLAALAVVLVQNVVDDTAEEISGNNARETAARVAADRIDADAREAIRNADSDNNATTLTVSAPDLSNINSDFESKCERLAITYSDIEFEPQWTEFPSSIAVAHATADALDTALAAVEKRCKQKSA